MLISSLEIKNIRKFEDKSYEFKPGLNIILGENFAGKTTICESIFYGLFGEPLKGKKNANALARYDASFSEVSLSLRQGQDNIQIIRRIPNEVMITTTSQNQSRSITSRKDIDIFFKALFQQNENALRFSFLCESEVTEFITLTKADRRDLIYGIAGINTLEEIRDIFIENRKQSKREEKSIQTEVTALGNQLKYDAEGLFVEAKNRKDDLQKKYESLLDKVVSAAKSDTSAGIKADLENLKKDRDEKHRDLITKLGDFKNIEGINEFLQNLDEAEKELAEKTKEYDILDQRVKTGKAFIAQIDAHLDELDNIRKDVSNPNCPLCLQPLAGDKLSHVVSANLAKKRKAGELLAELQNQLDKLQKDIEQCKQLLSEKPDLTLRKGIVNILGQDIEKLNESIRNKEMLLRTHGTEQQTTEPGGDLNSLKLSLDLATKEYEQLLIQKTIHDRNAENYMISQRKLEYIKKTRAICEAAVAATEKCLERVIRDIFVTAGAGIKTFINDLGVLPDYEVDISVEDYMPVVYKSDRKIDINSLSGSEKSLVYIGLKLAVSTAFNNRFLVLDDPAIHLDPARQRDFIKSMYTLSLLGKQIILMTSNPALLIDEANVIRI